MRSLLACLTAALLFSCATTSSVSTPAETTAPTSPTAPPAPEAAAEPAPSPAPEPKPEAQAEATATKPEAEAPEDAPAPKPALPKVDDLSADQHLEQGTAALRAKDAPLAIAHLSACVKKEPNRVDCNWELGWAHYLASEWEEVIAVWETVQRLDPRHEDVERRLGDARNQLELRRKLDAMAKQAPSKVEARPPPDVSLRLRAVGDVMLGTDFPEGYMPPEDGALMLAGVKDWLTDADLTFINLEGPLCDNPKPSDKCRRSKNCYAFRTPTRYVKYLVETGVDLASTANNHSGDFGEECRRETEAALDGVNIKWSGAPGTIASMEKNGLKIAMVAFHTSVATNNVNDHATAAALVKAADLNHDLVIVSFHGGAEGAKATNVPNGREVFFGEDRGDLRTFTHLVIDAGADLVLGHGPHVLRAMELYNDRLIAYSLGNFATYGRFSLGGALGIGAVLEVVMDGEGRFVSGKVLPTRQAGKGVPEKDPNGTAIKYIRLLSEEDFPTTGVIVDAEGNLAPRQQAPTVQTEKTAP